MTFLRGTTWIDLLVGIWLIAAPFALSVSATHRTWTINDMVMGVLLVGLSLWILSAAAMTTAATWFVIFCGVWLIVAPFVLSYGRLRPAAVNDVLAGVVAVIVTAIGAMGMTERHRTA